MSAEVIDFQTRARLPGGSADDLEEPFDVMKELLHDDEKEPDQRVLDVLRKIEQMGNTSRIGGLVIIAQDNRTGYFLSEICLPDGLDRHEIHGFVGLLENLKLELCEKSSMAPFITLDGHVVDPYEEHSQ